MAELDDVYRQLGKLTAVCEESQRQITSMFAKHDKVSEEVIEQRGALKVLSQLAVENKQHIAQVKVKVDSVHQEHEEYKNKGKGAAIGLMLIGGGGGVGGLLAAWKAFFT